MSTSPASSRDSLPKNWNILVISFVICGCTVLLVFSYFSILRRLCFRFRTRTLSGNRLQRRRLSEANPDDPSLQFQSYGLDASVVQALPVVQFKGKSKDGEANKSVTDCAVCLGEFEDGEWIKHLPNCTHVFHVACIDTWFESHSNCPLCRSHVLYSNDNSSSFQNDEECPVSVRSLLETLRREEFLQERTRYYHILRADILHNTFRNEPTHTT